MVQALSAFMDFCYLVRRNILDESTLDAIDTAVGRFHANRIIFKDLGIRNNFSLPRQYSVKHFRLLIQMFGAPNGLCSSITESKHIKAVKEPYRRSSHLKLWVKCYSLIKESTNLQHSASISLLVVCWMAHAWHLASFLSCCRHLTTTNMMQLMDQGPVYR